MNAPDGTQRSLLLAGFLVLVGAATAGAVSSFVQNGIISVQVHEHRRGGDNISLQVPAVAADLAMDLMPKAACRQARASISRWSPLVRTACSQLADYPDFTLARVERDGEHVLVEKVRSNLHVWIDSDDATVDVKIPLRTVMIVMRRLARADESA